MCTFSCRASEAFSLLLFGHRACALPIHAAGPYSSCKKGLTSPRTSLQPLLLSQRVPTLPTKKQFRNCFLSSWNPKTRASGRRSATDSAFWFIHRHSGWRKSCPKHRYRWAVEPLVDLFTCHRILNHSVRSSHFTTPNVSSSSSDQSPTF
jgi:hypothetical protein